MHASRSLQTLAGEDRLMIGRGKQAAWLAAPPQSPPLRLLCQDETDDLFQ